MSTEQREPSVAEYRRVMDANVTVHAKMATDYKRCEPHFRAENVAKVRAILARLIDETAAKRLLDLGCGTGFIIDIVRDLVEEVHGVDITQEMLAQVDLSGPAMIAVSCMDSARFERDPGSFDLVTSYSFLHHLYDIQPTLRAAYRALRPGGIYYADLEPNRDFWDALSKLDPAGDLDPVVKLEVQKTRFKDHEVAGSLGIDKHVLDRAEYGKNIRGGFGTDELIAKLHACGFSQVTVMYNWFLGQAALLNDSRHERSTQLALAERIDEVLRRALPLSRAMYKYLGFIATK